jgi:hypothetical protein
MTETYSKTRLTDYGIEIGERYSDAIDYLDQNREVAYQDDNLVIYVDPTLHALDDWANTIGVSRAILSRIMHDIANDVMNDAGDSFANADPLVIRKP